MGAHDLETPLLVVAVMEQAENHKHELALFKFCLLYTSDAADE